MLVEHSRAGTRYLLDSCFRCVFSVLMEWEKLASLRLKRRLQLLWSFLLD